MRSFALVVVLGLLLAGCLQTQTEDRQGTAVRKIGGSVRTSIEVGTIIAEGASQTVLPGGIVRLIWEGNLAGPLRHEMTIPGSVVAMRARFDLGATGGSLAVYEPETGANRCFSTTALLNTLSARNVVTCSGVTVLDTELAHEAKYSVALNGGSAQAPAKYVLELDLLPGPLDGPAALLDIGALPRIQYGFAKQFTDRVPSSIDGARMFVEVNLPDGEGPWPTIHIASPYNQPVRDAGQLTQGVRVKDWVPRGYAVVVSDVRGFANSEGCVEVWGPKEQQDQYDVVEWIAQQPWSDGKVAMYGQSYVGTTPHEAAVKKAPHLVAIATVAGLTDPYFDWHYGGVPNGESSGSPVAYSVTTDQPPRAPQDPQYLPDWFGLARTQGCDLAPMVVAANDPNAVHGQFYDERNFTAKAHEIQVPVLYTQGYIDQNVKVSQAIRFFDEIPTEKIGVFGPWLHRHPPRGDFDLLLHAWMARWLMDAPTNVEEWPQAEAITNLDTVRQMEMWPPKPDESLVLYPDMTGSALTAQAPRNRVAYEYVAAPGPAGSTTRYRFESGPVSERTYIAGIPVFFFTSRVDGSPNAHYEARLVDVDPSGAELQITFGMLNGGLRNGYEEFEPMPANTDVDMRMELLPTEYVVEPGHKIALVVGPASATQSTAAPGRVTMYTGGDPAPKIVIPILLDPMDEKAPLSVLGFEAFAPRLG